jgi:hypothetical protein
LPAHDTGHLRTARAGCGTSGEGIAGGDLSGSGGVRQRASDDESASVVPMYTPVTPGFDPATGTLTTDAGVAVGPALTRTAFLASPLATDAAILVTNDSHGSWATAAVIAGQPFRLGLYFEAERLTMVVAALDDPAFGRSWADWSRAREADRKAAHEAWLATFDATIGDGRDYPWGFVSSVYDDRSGGSEIVIRYGTTLPERMPPSPIDFRRHP